jgi:hypothetical protein
VIGYKYSGGVIRVSKGSLVVMESNKIDGLYVLLGNKMTDLADVYSPDNFKLLAGVSTTE